MIGLPAVDRGDLAVFGLVIKEEPVVVQLRAPAHEAVLDARGRDPLWPDGPVELPRFDRDGLAGVLGSQHDVVLSGRFSRRPSAYSFICRLCALLNCQPGDLLEYRAETDK